METTYISFLPFAYLDTRIGMTSSRKKDYFSLQVHVATITSKITLSLARTYHKRTENSAS